MRIVITADLHYRPAQRHRYVELARQIAAQQPDCLIVAGDVGHPLRLFERGLTLFEALRCPKLLVAGNHDLYRSEHGSRALWESILPQATQRAGFVWLEEQSVLIGDVGICGTMGWYDYSTSAAHLAVPTDVYPLLKELVNHDADYIDWPWSDRAMARYLQRGFHRRLAALETDPSVARILVVTHMPIFDEMIPNYPQSEKWSLLRAYMGNLTLGELVRSCPKVTHVVSGHLHRGSAWQITRTGGCAIDCRVIGASSGVPDFVTLVV
jgi:predicted phosphohydrolase